MRVVGYYVYSNCPIKVILLRKGKYIILSSEDNYNAANGTVGGCLNFRELFLDNNPPKKFVDKVKIIKKWPSNDKRFPLEIVKQGTLEDILMSTRFSYSIDDLKNYFIGLADMSKLITIYDKCDQVNQTLFTDTTKMTESDFINKYIHSRMAAAIRTKILNNFLVKRGTDMYLPREDKFYFLYLDEDDPCLSMGATLATERVIMGKIFKHLTEKMCPFITVSLCRETHINDTIMNVIFSNPNNIKLEFNPCKFAACYSHEVKLNDDDGLIYRHRNNAGLSESNSVDILSLLVSPSLFNECKKKYGGKREITIKGNNDMVHRCPVIIKFHSHYLCYDQITARILCHGKDLKKLVDEKLKGLIVVVYGLEQDFVKLRHKRIKRLITKPNGYEIMKGVARILSKKKRVLKNKSNYEWYTNGSVICETKKNVRYEKTTCFDFNNFYGTSLKVHRIDPGLEKTTDMLIDARQYGANSETKRKLVSIFGVAKYHDVLLYNLIKHASVTCCLATIDRNKKKKKKLISVTTDGLTYAGSYSKIILADPRYKIKKEYKFTKYAFYSTCNKFIGWDCLAKKFITKGIVGRNNPPVIKNVIDEFMKLACKMLEKRKKSTRKVTPKIIIKKISKLLSPSEAYLFVRHPLNEKRTYYPAEFAYNDLCQDRLLCFADYSKFPNNKKFFSTIHQKKNPEIVDHFFSDGLSYVNSTFKIDHAKYSKILVSKLETSCQLLLDAYPNKRKIVELMLSNLITTINRTLECKINTPQDAAVIPGALFDLS